VTPLFLCTAALYAVAALAFAGHLLGRKERVLHLARGLLGLALLVHLAYIGWLCTQKLNPLLDIRGALSFSGWLLASGYLLATWRSKLAVIGVLLTPASLGFLVASRLTPARASSEGVFRTAQLLSEVHIALSAIGVAIFGLAAAVAMFYLIVDRSIKSKRTSSLLRRSPPLKSLDDAGRKLILLGFPIFTLAVISGLIWVTRLPARGGVRPEYIISAMTWLVFAGLITSRVTVGWRGRKAALLTLVGFFATLAVLLVYMGRRMWGG
jgi:ABC-type uncharacterized transport system permease subunit